MKKNLRIVSVAAAALLAVAPVAASTVMSATSVYAADEPDKPDNTLATVGTAHINVGGTGSIRPNTDVSKLDFSVSLDVTGANVPTAEIESDKGKYEVYACTDVDVDKNGKPTVKPGAKQIKTLQPKTDYIVINQFVKVTGLDPNTKYNLKANRTFIQITTGSGDYGKTDSQQFPLAEEFTTSKPRQGSPYVYNKATNKLAESGEIGLVDGYYDVNSVVKAIKTKYAVRSDTDKSSKKSSSGSFTQLPQDVRQGLKKSVHIDKNGNFAKPSLPIVLTLNIQTTNGNKNTWKLTVYPNAIDADETFPTIRYDGDAKGVPHKGVTDVVNVDGEKFNNVELGGTVNVPLIESRFSANMSSDNYTHIPVKVDISKVNTAVAGVYPVTVSATNTENKTSSVTFYLTVGAKGATYKTVQADTAEIPVYEITGNTVTTSKTTVKNGDKIATFGTVTINGKSYTRINSANSTKFIETKYVDGSVKPVATVTKKVMHNAYIYDKNHKRIGTKMLGAYSNVDVYGATTKLADGSLVYKIGDNQYVMADNIDGTARTLTHNAYVYKTSKKRADGRKLLKGSTVTTYGSPYKFKNGKKYYRIGGPRKQYVKVANF